MRQAVGEHCLAIANLLRRGEARQHRAAGGGVHDLVPERHRVPDDVQLEVRDQILLADPRLPLELEVAISEHQQRLHRARPVS